MSNVPITPVCYTCCTPLAMQQSFHHPDGAMLAFYTCPECDSIYSLFVSPRLPDDGCMLFQYVGERTWKNREAYHDTDH